MAFERNVLSLTPEERRYIRGAIWKLIHEEIGSFYNELMDTDAVSDSVDDLTDNVIKLDGEMYARDKKRFLIDKYANKCLSKNFDEIIAFLQSKKELIEFALKWKK